MKAIISIICFLIATFSLMERTMAAQTLDDLEREGVEQCTKLAARMFSSKSKPNMPRKASNFAALVTWRASCAEKPPKGPGNVTALCEADAQTQSGEKKRVFFWEKSENGKKHTGYYWCEQ